VPAGSDADVGNMGGHEVVPDAMCMAAPLCIEWLPK
jgi:hypothetical protein